MHKRLYIIGNGFDLHHCLNSSYGDFAKFLIKKDQDLYDTLESYISFPESDNNLWWRFEENLANLDVEEILSKDSYRLPDYSSDEFRDSDRYAFPDVMDEYFQKLTIGLLDVFEEFIQNIEFPENAFEKRIELDKNAKFLTFNYTNTLERLYNLDRENIFYIHNSAFYGSDKIILGHGIDPKSFEKKEPEPPLDLEPEDLEDWYSQNDDYDYSYTTGKEKLMCYFQEMYKPTENIIQKNSAFFESLSEIEEVFVLGHSLSCMDLPYFEKIVKSVQTETKWTVSYYNSAEYNRHLNTLKSIQINETNLNLIELTDLQKYNKQLKIIFDDSIEKNGSL